MHTPKIPPPIFSALAKPMGYLTLLGLVAAGCSSNTAMDDHNYRSLGGAKSPTPVTSKLSEGLASRLEQVDGSGNLASLSSSALNDTEGQAHVVRYGHGKIIDKIVKTATIHCNPLTTDIETDQNSYWGASKGTMRQCTYQFPKHCGAAKFTVLHYNNRKALLFHIPDTSNYIVDMLAGTPLSKPGLWDKDDRTGSFVGNIGYKSSDYDLASQGERPLQLGWIIRTSFDEETSLGKGYHAAIKSTLGCF